MENYYEITSNDVVLNIYDGADNKRTAIIDGKQYLLKLPSVAKHNLEAS